MFCVLEIPKLILLDEKGGLITTKGCNCVSSDPNGEVSKTLLSITVIVITILY